MIEQDDLTVENLCQRTLNRYAIAVGKRDHVAFADLFCKEGVWQRPGQKPLIGRTAIRKFMNALDPLTLVRHVNGSVRIDRTGADTATGISYTTVYNAVDHKGGIASMRGPDYIVEYHDRFLRVQEDWLIERRDTFIIFRADHAADLPGIPNAARR